MVSACSLEIAEEESLSGLGASSWRLNNSTSALSHSGQGQASSACGRWRRRAVIAASICPVALGCFYLLWKPEVSGTNNGVDLSSVGLPRLRGKKKQTKKGQSSIGQLHSHRKTQTKQDKGRYAASEYWIEVQGGGTRQVDGGINEKNNKEKKKDEELASRPHGPRTRNEAKTVELIDAFETASGNNSDPEAEDAATRQVDGVINEVKKENNKGKRSKKKSKGKMQKTQKNRGKGDQAAETEVADENWSMLPRGPQEGIRFAETPGESSTDVAISPPQARSRTQAITFTDAPADSRSRFRTPRPLNFLVLRNSTIGETSTDDQDPKHTDSQDTLDWSQVDPTDGGVDLGSQITTAEDHYSHRWLALAEETKVDPTDGGVDLGSQITTAEVPIAQGLKKPSETQKHNSSKAKDRTWRRKDRGIKGSKKSKKGKKKNKERQVRMYTGKENEILYAYV